MELKVFQNLETRGVILGSAVLFDKQCPGFGVLRAGQIQDFEELEIWTGLSTPRSPRVSLREVLGITIQAVRCAEHVPAEFQSQVTVA